MTAKKTKTCSLCWRPREIQDVCKPCYQSLRRMYKKSLHELAFYLDRVASFRSRAIRVMGGKRRR